MNDESRSAREGLHDLAIGGDGLQTVWRHDRSIYSAEHGLKPEKFLGRSEQPSIVAASGGYFISWVDRRGGDLLLLRPAFTNPVPIATKASDPVLAASVTGDGPVNQALKYEDGRPAPTPVGGCLFDRYS